MLGFVADIFRTFWGLFYWNLRKSAFRARRGRGRCPCQTPSDSGLAGETGCEPAHDYVKPARFQRVCPLLQPNAEGLLRCSVNTAQVRPFWGRFWLLYGGISLTLLLGSVGSVYGVMRLVGYPVTLRMIAWPPAWAEITLARSAYFLDRAREAQASGDIADAMLSLSLAYEYDPSNYDAGLLLARL